MGKIFPQIKTLKEKPELLGSTLSLIEKSFQYQSPHHFQTDFAPLVDQSNHHHCYILIDENNQVLAHIAVKERVFTLNGKSFPVTLLGGIAVDETRRGEGHFQTLFTDILADKRSDTTCFLLWSDLEKLYNKFGFHLAGTQFELPSKSQKSPLLKTTFASLTATEKKQVAELYENSFRKTYLTLERSHNDWEIISKITSADLYLEKNNDKIVSYYFQNKGQDLPEIIYEYGSQKELAVFLKEISAFGKVWMGSNIIETENLQYQFFMCPGDLKHFTEFILEITEGKFIIRNINLMKQEVFFDFNNETLSLELPEFLRGVFGPGVFEELNLRPLFISGLDSI